MSLFASTGLVLLFHSDRETTPDILGTASPCHEMAVSNDKTAHRSQYRLLSSSVIISWMEKALFFPTSGNPADGLS